MIGAEIRRLSTGPRDLRKFGVLVGSVFALLAGWCWWRGKAGTIPFLALAVPLVAAGLVFPRGLKWPYLAWMSLGIALGYVVSTVLLSVFYFVVLTPVAWLARAVGNDFLQRRRDANAPSYWSPRKVREARRGTGYEQQF